MTLWFRLCFAGIAAFGQSPELSFNLDSLKSLAEQLRKGRLADPLAPANQALARAEAKGDLLSQAYARVWLAGLEERALHWADAEAKLREAAALANRAGDRRFLGQAALWLAFESKLAVRADRTLTWADLAAGEFRRAGDHRNLALALQTAAAMTTAKDLKKKLLLEALDAARIGGDALDIATIQGEWGESLRLAGDLAGAIRNLEESAQALQQQGAWIRAGRSLTLLARANTAHGRYREALQQLQTAEGLLGKEGDRQAVLGAQIEMGRLLAASGDRKAALETLERVRTALESPDTPPTLRLRMPLLAYGYLGIGDYQKAADVAREVIRAFPLRAPAASHWILGAAYFHLGRYQDSIDAATTGIHRTSDPEAITNIPAFRWRARSLDRLGRFSEAARDALEVSRLGSVVLDQLVPEDDWKRVFTDSRQQYVDDVIAILCRAGKPLDALYVAEKFRARAFLDLVASRGDSEPLVSDGAAANHGGPRLASAVLSAPLTTPQLSALAVRSGSPILSYWVHPEGVYVWALMTSGEIHSAHVAISEQRLRALVDRARSLRYKPDRDAWRELFQILIQPVRRWLPAANGQLLTVLPHGVLLQLPFAALLDRSGRYLLEDYALRVSPAAGFLLQAPGPRHGSVALIGAPDRMSAGNVRLPALPGASRELQRIAALLPRMHRLVSGPAVVEQRVRDEAAQAAVLHLATHAILDAAQPFDSFLALSGGERLTVRSIYDLRTFADLVLLSSCRGGSGNVSADGLLGFTRAFLYAGAASVIAPLWDIPDEPTARFAEAFYREYRRGLPKGQALRAAQLKLLRDLRAGAVSVPTPAGPMTLPEHPGLWAGFVLQGAN